MLIDFFEMESWRAKSFDTRVYEDEKWEDGRDRKKAETTLQAAVKSA